MSPSPSEIRTRQRITTVAALFALASIIWSTLTIRRQLRDERLALIAERADRARGWNSEPDDPQPFPARALSAYRARRSTADVTRREALFGTTNVWTVHLRFSPDAWSALEPGFVRPLDRAADRSADYGLRNPREKRSGLAGVRGLEFNWVHATVEFEDRTYPDAAVRYKGNGTYLRSQNGIKRPFKVDLDRQVPADGPAGRTTLNFANLVTDDSCLHDTLAYEVYRDAGVPAPRTAFARLFLTTNAAPARALGLYALVENLDRDFAADQFGTRAGALFKPVTPRLFADLGDDWDDYRPIYDPKHRITAEQSRRVIDFARLVTGADDATFAARAGEFLDTDAFARFLAVTVLLSSYDSFLSNGQNFYLWLSPDSGKFHFLPWDLDNAWGKFGGRNTARERAHASIRHPWVGEHRLLERWLSVPAFRERYLATLGQLLDSVFQPRRLHRRVEELAALVRPLVAEESARKSARFEVAVTAERLDPATDDGRGFGRRRVPHPLKWFITERARSVRDQLSGQSEGVILGSWR